MRVDLIRKVPLFSTLTDDEFRRLSHIFVTRAYRRNQIIFLEEETGNYVWIDFDYDYSSPENPFSLDIFGMGNILLNAVGKGFHNLDMIRNNTQKYGDLINHVDDSDFSIFNKRRFMNLRKLYKYIPAPLNNMLAHFSRGAEVFYESTDEIIEDLYRCLYSFVGT